MDAATHLDHLRAEGERLAAMPADALGAPVPSVPEWTLEDVVRHTAQVHRWVTGTLAAGPHGDLTTRAADQPEPPTGPACLADYRDALHGLLDEFARHHADDAVPTFVGPGTVAFWARRQANEVAIHRIDAADAVHAAGGPPPEPLDPTRAADAIDEWANLFLATRWRQRHGTYPPELTGRSLHIHGTDDPVPANGAEWLIEFTGDTVEVAATHAKGDAALRAPVEALVLALYRRRPVDTIDVVGDAALVRHVLDTFRW